MSGRPTTDAEQLQRARAIQARFLRRRNQMRVGADELARRARLNRRTLDKYFEGDSPSPSFFLLAALAEALELSLDDLAKVGRRRRGGR